MSLLDLSLILLLAVPCTFFIGVAYLYCRHAKQLIQDLRRKNINLSKAKTALEEDNGELRKGLAVNAPDYKKERYGIN